MTVLAIFIGGFLVGVVGAFLGIGGGVIIVPMLTIIFKYPVHEAVATSLAIVVVNSIITSRQYLNERPSTSGEPPKKGAANLELALFIALFSVAGSLMGSMISLSLPEGILYLVLGCSQMLTIGLMIAKSRFKGTLYDTSKPGHFYTTYYDGSTGKNTAYSLYNLPPTAAVSTFSGVLSGLVGIGGGVMIVPAMNIFSGMPMKAATATSVLVMGFTAAGGGILFFLNGLTHAITVMVMVPAIYLGSKLAVKAAVKVSGELVYRVFMVFLFLIACQMLYKGVNGL